MGVSLCQEPGGTLLVGRAGSVGGARARQPCGLVSCPRPAGCPGWAPTGPGLRSAPALATRCRHCAPAGPPCWTASFSRAAPRAVPLPAPAAPAALRNGAPLLLLESSSSLPQRKPSGQSASPDVQPGMTVPSVRKRGGPSLHVRHGAWPAPAAGSVSVNCVSRRLWLHTRTRPAGRGGCRGRWGHRAPGALAPPAG